MVKNQNKCILVLASGQISKLVKRESNVGWLNRLFELCPHLQGGASVEMPVGETGRRKSSRAGQSPGFLLKAASEAER